MSDEYRVTFGQPRTRVKRSKYAPRVEVIKARNRSDPDEWGKVAEFAIEGSARQLGSMLRKTNPDVTFLIEQDLDTLMWLVWGKVTEDE